MQNRELLIKELLWQNAAEPIHKDIIIVVRNQSEYVEKCLNSIQKNTKNYHLFLWDNNSDEETSVLLRKSNPAILYRSPENIGFIKPNNYLINYGNSPIVILLNSDTIVSSGWDEALIGALNHYDVVGYQGGLLDENYYGYKIVRGDKIDYVAGWCLCFKRQLYSKLGLFDDKLDFAYGEDSDFGLKCKQNGYSLYALHLDYVKHFGGLTTQAVSKEKDITESFKKNHLYLKEKYGSKKN